MRQFAPSQLPAGTGLDPASLLLLLAELKLKLTRALQPPKAVPWGGGAPKAAGYALLARHPAAAVAAWAIKLLPHLCRALEQASEFFQAIIADNDGMRDATLFDKVPGAGAVATCFLRLVENIAVVVAWPALESPENKCARSPGFLLSLPPAATANLLDLRPLRAWPGPCSSR